MTNHVSVDETFRLARAMTLKNVLAGIPFGGAKAGIVWKGDKHDLELKEQYVRSFARLLKPYLGISYISAPDVNVGEREIRWFVNEAGDWNAATGKPHDLCIGVGLKKKCGIPHEVGSTGFGVAHATAEAAGLLGIDIKEARIAIHGFGNVAMYAFKHLAEMGAKIVAVANSRFGLHDEGGLDIHFLHRVVSGEEKLDDHPGEKLEPDEFWDIESDILIPASVTDVVNSENRDRVKTKLIVEGANIPLCEESEKILFEKGIAIVPDIVANSGGVISSYAEYKGLSVDEMFNTVKEKVMAVTKEVMEKSLESNIHPREVALNIAHARLEVLKTQDKQ
jgi:glutamate dehydrogenase (NAD(P)+)